MLEQPQPGSGCWVPEGAYLCSMRGNLPHSTIIQDEGSNMEPFANHALMEGLKWEGHEASATIQPESVLTSRACVAALSEGC